MWFYLHDDRGHTEGEWNYTSNCNRMANDAVFDEIGGPWWMHLSGMSGPDGAAFLNLIINGLTTDSGRYVAMNPKNGWGDYASFVELLTEMRNAVPEWPTEWTVNG